MEELLKILELQYDLIYLQKKATKLDKIFRVNSFWNGWRELERELFYGISIDLDYYKSRYHYSDIYNLIIMRYGKTERLVKYYLSKEFIKNDNEVCLFEFKVGNSRLDFGRINGNSYAYEIKTELDNTNRLLDQIADYTSVFEYVNVVIHEKHLNKIQTTIPKKVGIIVYKFNNRDIVFEPIRTALEIKNTKKTMQLEMLNSDDLDYILKKIMKIDKVPYYKKDKVNTVKKYFSSNEFNIVFKETIKNRQLRKWKHVKDNFDMLKPIELQDAYTYEINIDGVKLSL